MVFGNEEYDNFSNVDYAINDATSFANYCNKVLGVPESNIRVRKNATFSQMKEQINYLTKKANLNPDKLEVLVYYAVMAYLTCLPTRRICCRATLWAPTLSSAISSAICMPSSTLCR